MGVRRENRRGVVVTRFRGSTRTMKVSTADQSDVKCNALGVVGGRRVTVAQSESGARRPANLVLSSE